MFYQLLRLLIQIKLVLLYVYTLCLKKRVLPNFGNNFVISRPIFKILSLLERELNETQKSHNIFALTRLKKFTTAIYPKF